MTFNPRLTGAAALAAAGLLTSASPALAHGLAGARFFPATIATDDPAVADELSLPTIARLDGETEVSGEYSKRLTDTIGLSFEGGWTRGDDAAGAPQGFQNLESTLKWQFLTDAEHETILAAGLGVEWGGTGADRVGAESTTVVTPTVYFGKGLGDLPDSAGWARPIAVTGLVGYGLPTRGRDKAGDLNPYSLTGGFSVQYSLPYLVSQVRDPGWPAWVGRLTPLVEVTFDQPLRHGGGEGLTGTVNPGVLWTGKRVQWGIEAIIPLNSDSGDGIGWAVQTHWFLDDLLPGSLGRPIWSGAR